MMIELGEHKSMFPNVFACDLFVCLQCFVSLTLSSISIHCDSYETHFSDLQICCM